MWRGTAENQQNRSYGRTHLVRILDEDVFALRLFHAHVRNRADDAPAISKRDVELRREVRRPRRSRAKDDMPSIVARVDTGYPSASKEWKMN